jgi:hypothetical protein
MNDKTKQKFRFVSGAFKNVQMNLVEETLNLNRGGTMKRLQLRLKLYI